MGEKGVNEEFYQKIKEEARQNPDHKQLMEEKEEHWKKLKQEAFKIISDKSFQIEEFGKVQPLFYDKSGNWWLWNKLEYKWVLVDEIDILNMMQDAGHQTIASKEKTELLNALKQAGRRRMPKPIKNSWIQFKNIIYDLKTGESFEATPDYFITNPIPWELSSSTETPTMDRIFGEWVGKENIQTLYEIIAYCMLMDYPINRLFCLIGSGMNGKSCFLRLLLKTIGEENACSTELDLLIKSRFEVTKLHKKLVCIMGETNFNELSQTSILKKLTGGDLIGFEYKNKLPFNDKNYAKIIIATNNLPVTTDKTEGFYRRWYIVDFPNKFSEKKDILSEIPEEEYNNLVSKCLLILNDLLIKREFTNEGTIELRMERFEARSDFLQKFIDLFTEQDINGYVTKHDFMKKFGGWCKERGFRQLADNTIGTKMKEKGFETSKKYYDWFNEGKGGQAWIWYGLKWKI